jgi:pimeloyl-ACP methyl ester carboxylesterase
MHYVIGGNGDPVVLLHGWPQTWYEWRNIIPELISNNYTVIARYERSRRFRKNPNGI